MITMLQRAQKFALVSIIFGVLGQPEQLIAQKFKIPALETFISDTLFIEINPDSGIDLSKSQLKVIDSREVGNTILGIRQTKKYRYIPVDQYLALDQSFENLFKSQFLKDSLDLKGTLHLSHLILWTDNLSSGKRGLSLNAYTAYHDSMNRPVSDWMWDLRVEREKKEEDSVYLSRVVQSLLKHQSTALAEGDFNPDFYPHLYRRQLMSWSELIFFKDGYAINVHFTLDFPPDHNFKWKRTSPGLFYRKSDIHESIAIGGKDRQFFQRLNDKWITRVSGTFRLGFNNFEGGHFDHLDYWNIFYLNLSSQAIIEYRPKFHKGVFGGFGLYTGFNILPDVIPQTEIGMLLNVGVLLP